MLNPLTDTSQFLIKTLFDLYTLVILLRLILQWVGVHPQNQIAQFIYKVTQPLVGPAQRFIPRYHGIDFPVVLVLIVTQMIKLTLLQLLTLHQFPHILGLIVLAFADVLVQTINLFFYAIIAWVILSWVAPQTPSPISDILYRLTSPILMPIQRFIPIISGIDLSPIAAMIILYALYLLIAAPLVQIGSTMALIG